MHLTACLAAALSYLNKLLPTGPLFCFMTCPLWTEVKQNKGRGVQGSGVAVWRPLGSHGAPDTLRSDARFLPTWIGGSLLSGAVQHACLLLMDTSFHLDLAKSIVPGFSWDSQSLPSAQPQFHSQLQSQAATSTPARSLGLPYVPDIATPVLSQSQQQVQDMNQDGQTMEQLGSNAERHGEQVPAMPHETRAWLGQAGVSEANLQRLAINGFTSRQALQAMDPKDLELIGIQPLGQIRLLVSLTSTPQAVSPPAPAKEVDRIADLLRALPPADAEGGQDPPAATAQAPRPTSLAGERHDIAPSSILLPPAKTKYHDIVDFLHGDREQEEDQTVWGDEESSLIIRSGRKKALDKVSPHQWGAANLRIMFELHRTGQLVGAALWDYLAYTVKVHDLAATYTWPSLLLYDREYRKAQAREGFRWGSDTPHVDRLYLRYREPVVGQAGKKGQGAPKTPNKADICRLYQKDNCPFGAECRFRHVCSAPSCNGRHPLARHGQKDDDNVKNRPPKAGNAAGQE